MWHFFDQLENFTEDDDKLMVGAQNVPFQFNDINGNPITPQTVVGNLFISVNTDCPLAQSHRETFSIAINSAVSDIQRDIDNGLIDPNNVDINEILYEQINVALGFQYSGCDTGSDTHRPNLHFFSDGQMADIESDNACNFRSFQDQFSDHCNWGFY